jgi:hypothetical protein
VLTSGTVGPAEPAVTTRSWLICSVVGRVAHAASVSLPDDKLGLCRAVSQAGRCAGPRKASVRANRRLARSAAAACLLRAVHGDLSPPLPL